MRAKKGMGALFESGAHYQNAGIAKNNPIPRSMLCNDFWRWTMKPFLLCFFIAVPCFVFSQTAAELETLLATEAVSYGQAASFVLRAADIPAPGGAFDYMAGQNWLPAAATQDAAAKLDGVSLLVMRAFNMKGGAFYTIMRTPHYAYRELLYQNIIQGRADSDMAVSGDLLLFIVNRVLEQQEGEL